MFNILTAMRNAATGSFEWSGTFDIMPADPVAAETMLGIDGSLSTDLGNLSHHWRIGLGGVNGVTDIGTLTAGGINPGDFNMGTAAGTPQYLSNADYELGAAGREVFTLNGDTDAVATAGGDAGNFIPASPMTTGFRSFLCAVSFTPDSGNTGQAQDNRFILHNRNLSTGDRNGWYIEYGAVARQLRARIDYDTGADIITSSFAFAFDLPVFAVAIFDFADNKLKLIVAQGATIQYDEITLTGSGSFAATYRICVGKSPHWNIAWGGSSYGVIAQVNTFEWSAATPSGITAANVERYLKYTDGVLP
jgi:hypothetical protein